MSVDLKGRTALVTGSTSGISEAFVLGARSAHVLILGRKAERASRSWPRSRATGAGHR